MDNLIVVYDACVLYPAPLRDLLIHLALTGLFQAKWTEEIQDEWMRNLLKNRPDLRLEQLERTRRAMDGAVRDCLVEGYDSYLNRVVLPDENDRHVLATALHCGAGLIVTFNLADFPQAVLSEYGIRAEHPDEFVTKLIELNSNEISVAVERHRQSLKRPPKTREEYLQTLLGQGMTKTVDKLRTILKNCE